MFNLNLYTMKTTDRLIKAFEKLDQDIKAFGKETGEEDFVTLYEDALHSRIVKNFFLYKNGKLVWIEKDFPWTEPKKEDYIHEDDDDIRDTLKFWRACLNRAKRYWKMNAETLDKIQDGEIEDIEEE